MPGVARPQQLAYAAAVVGFAVYAIGFAASFWLPEPRARGAARMTKSDIAIGG